MVVSVLTFEAVYGGLWGLCGPHEGQWAFLTVREEKRELDPLQTQGY